MIFVGDIALPYKGAVGLCEIPEILKKKNWVGNLEGAVVDSNDFLRKQHVVFNDSEAICSLTKEYNFIGFASANNHIFDTGYIENTIGFLNKINVPYFGIGKDLTEAAKPLILNEGEREIILLNFGWEVIQCEITSGKFPGVNPLNKSHVFQSVKKAILDNPEAHVVTVMHWSYELEAEPQPFERQMAKQLVELGVAGVIGCHPHRIGGFEMYKGKPIVYSLGNWMFKQRYYHNGKLQFPDFCNQELAFEWDFKKNELFFHFFEFNKIDSILKYIKTEDVNSTTMTQYTPFRGLSDEEYKVWYKANHYHKNKGLPIYYWEDSEVKVRFKNRINKIRDFFINQLSKFR